MHNDGWSRRAHVDWRSWKRNELKKLAGPRTTSAGCSSRQLTKNFTPQASGKAKRRDWVRVGQWGDEQRWSWSEKRDGDVFGFKIQATFEQRGQAFSVRSKKAWIFHSIIIMLWFRENCSALSMPQSKCWSEELCSQAKTHTWKSLVRLRSFQLFLYVCNWLIFPY